MLTAQRDEILIPISATGSDATATLEVFEWVFQRGFTLVGISAHCDSDNPPTGSAAQIDVNIAGTSLLSTKITIDAGEFHSDTAATAPVLTTSPTVVAAGDLWTADIDQIGSTNAGQGYAIVLDVIRSL